MKFTVFINLIKKTLTWLVHKNIFSCIFSIPNANHSELTRTYRSHVTQLKRMKVKYCVFNMRTIIIFVLNKINMVQRTLIINYKLTAKLIYGVFSSYFAISRNINPLIVVFGFRNEMLSDMLPIV